MKRFIDMYYTPESGVDSPETIPAHAKIRAERMPSHAGIGYEVGFVYKGGTLKKGSYKWKVRCFLCTMFSSEDGFIKETERKKKTWPKGEKSKVHLMVVRGITETKIVEAAAKWLLVLEYDFKGISHRSLFARTLEHKPLS